MTNDLRENIKGAVCVTILTLLIPCTFLIYYGISQFVYHETQAVIKNVESTGVVAEYVDKSGTNQTVFININDRNKLKILQNGDKVIILLSDDPHNFPPKLTELCNDNS